jgi:hypothetical protein
MAIDVTFVPEEELIKVTCRGKITLGEIEAANKAGFTLASEHGVFRFLADTRQAKPGIGSYEIYDLPDSYVSLGLPRSAMIAVVAPAHTKDYDNYRFFETVCRNNGFHYVEIFDSMESAKKWLAGHRPPGSASPLKREER